MEQFGFDRLDSQKILCRLNETELAMDQLNLPQPKNGPRFPQKALDSRILSKWTESWKIDEKPSQPQNFFLSQPLLVLVKVSASRKPKTNVDKYVNKQIYKLFSKIISKVINESFCFLTSKHIKYRFLDLKNV